ncbi:hypothetical protein PG993_000570 [Apiospora rasikravindrae]|uniref:Uncharacterized protein n=1 Tax=Apiospora rasikravindrae TaxID=990691 RepID=A0ABR1U8X8_9PEZI
MAPNKAMPRFRCFPRGKADTNQGNDIGNHQAAANATESTHDAHGDQVVRVSAAQCPERPSERARSEYVLMPVDGAQTTAWIRLPGVSPPKTDVHIELWPGDDKVWCLLFSDTRSEIHIMAEDLGEA